VYTFNVISRSGAAVVAASTATGKLTVTGPNGYTSTPTLVSIAPATNARSIVATYSILPPSGSSFTAAANGSYIVSLAGGSISDTNNAFTPAITVGVFRSVIRVVPPPTSTLLARSVIAGSTSYTFKVTYRSGVGVVAASIATGNLKVTVPNGLTTTPALMSISPNANARSIV